MPINVIIALVMATIVVVGSTVFMIVGEIKLSRFLDEMDAQKAKRKEGYSHLEYFDHDDNGIL